jgi:hypothetical protein
MFSSGTPFVSTTMVLTQTSCNIVIAQKKENGSRMKQRSYLREEGSDQCCKYPMTVQTGPGLVVAEEDTSATSLRVSSQP